MYQRDLLALGYREVKHAGFSWLAREEGARFLIGVGDWSPRGLSARAGWSCWEKPHHTVYLAREQNGTKYLIKVYPPDKSRPSVIARKVNRAKNEFYKVLVAYKNEIQTVLPLAVGEWRKDRGWGLIIYPFLDGAITLERVYANEHLGLLGISIRERQYLEEAVGRLMRTLIDKGAYPVDAHLDHFLAVRLRGGKILIYYVDLERVRFNLWSTKLLKRGKLIKTLGRLLARLEWFRASGGRINRPSMMRIGCAYFRGGGLGALDKRLCRAVIRAAKKYFHRREFHMRGSYPLRSIEPDE
ncbi:MAG: hypothetical protein ACE5JU_00885 [Candidatus Binatia bacterium]